MWRWWSQQALLARRQGTGASRLDSENPPDESFCVLLEVVRNLSFQWFVLGRGSLERGSDGGEERREIKRRGRKEGDTLNQTGHLRRTEPTY